MGFRNALDNIIQQEGIKEIDNIIFLNMLDDYLAFKSHPSYRFIFRQLQIDSLIIRIIESSVNDAVILINRFISKTGLDRDSVFSLINDIYESVNNLSLPKVRAKNPLQTEIAYNEHQINCHQNSIDALYNLDYTELHKYSLKQRDEYVEKIERFLLSLVKYRTNWEERLGINSVHVSIEFRYDYCSCIYFGPISQQPRCNAIIIRLECLGVFKDCNSKTEFKAIIYNHKKQILGYNDAVLSKSDKRRDYNLIEFSPFYGEKYLDISKISEIRLNSH